MARPFLLLTILNDAGSLHAIPPGADAEISGHAPLVAELVGNAIGVFTNLAADAQQAAMPIVGFVTGRSPEESARLGAAFRKGLNETGSRGPERDGQSGQYDECRGH